MYCHRLGYYRLSPQWGCCHRAWTSSSLLSSSWRYEVRKVPVSFTVNSSFVMWLLDFDCPIYDASKFPTGRMPMTEIPWYLPITAGLFSPFQTSHTVHTFFTLYIAPPSPPMTRVVFLNPTQILPYAPLVFFSHVNAISVYFSSPIPPLHSTVAVLSSIPKILYT